MSALARILEPEVMDTVEEAEEYDSMDHSMVNQLFVDDLISFAAAMWNDSTGRLPNVVDLGTGTALIPLALLSKCPGVNVVIACDLSIEMLRLALQHVDGASHSKTILPAFCDAKRLPVADTSCDILMSNSIVHHIPEPTDVFCEMKRILRLGGVLFVRDLMRPEDHNEVECIVETYAGHENACQKQLFRQSLHAALTLEEVKTLLENCNFDPDWATATSDRHWTIAGVNQ